ncbi:MOSC domain-containing protein [Nocardioidaceae bacterium]|nr:MOSC domain-containing protein [Nocardioidaceae bacterium]
MSTDRPHVRSVCVGRAADVQHPGGVERTAIGKEPVQGRVRLEPAGPLGEAGAVGDEIVDDAFHGGRDQAVYAYAREDLDHFVELLGVPVPDGFFGENLTTSGIDLNACLVGERWRLGEGGPLLEVASVRTPCRTFALWLTHHGIDATSWVKRFTREGRSGAYLRVLEPGTVGAGDGIDVVSRPGHDVDVATMFRAMTTGRDLLPRLREVEDLAVVARERLEAYEASRR